MSKKTNTFKSNTTALAPEVLAWVKEYKKKIEDTYIEDIPVKDTLFYKYAGILTKEYKIYTDKYNVDPLFVCDLPSEVVDTLDRLVDDVKKQALTEYVSLFNPLEAFGLYGGWVSEWDEEEDEDTSDDKMGAYYEYSYLPKSLVRFAKETDAPYELIVHIVALTYSPNIAKITLFDEHLQFPFEHPFTSNYLIMTSDYDKAKGYIDDMKFVYEDCWYRYLSYCFGRRLPKSVNWHQLGLTIVTNDLGHEFFNRFIREDEE